MSSLQDRVEFRSENKLAAMPAMSSLVMMAKASGTEGDYVMGGIFVTTVCSIVTIPLAYWLLQLVG